ncbi:MAG: hypothetical protein J7L52_02370 [Thermotogae bacterium]|nr:hypothetical protein [Thermotogota bacterium]
MEEMIFIFLCVFLPMILGSVSFTFRKARYFIALVVSFTTAVLATIIITRDLTIHHTFEGSFGVEILIDRVSGFFMLTNALVTLGTVLFMKEKHRKTFPEILYPLVIFLHATVNASFISYDLFNIYVVVELTTIIAFILMGLELTPRQIWGAIKYLMVGNTGMIFYLLGCINLYQRMGSFSIGVIEPSMKLPIVLIVAGLAVKAAIFLFGTWLPDAHAEAETPVSALLSGVVIYTGIFPLIRLYSALPNIQPLLEVLGSVGAIFGAVCATLERDTKRLLAFSTLSHTGAILAAPPYSLGFMMAHGLFKSWLFLHAGNLKTRNMDRLREEGIHVNDYIPLFIGTLGMMAAPGLGGFVGKLELLNNSYGWVKMLLISTAVCTAAYSFSLISIPVKRQTRFGGFKTYDILYIVSLLLLGIKPMVYTLPNLTESMILMFAGYLVYSLMKPIKSRFHNLFEDLDNILTIAIVLVVLMMVGVLL